MNRIDQENASHDEDKFDPSRVARDYAEVATKLPVFCVSSKAYQKLSGRLERDEAITGFSDVSDTEIPALQKYAQSIVHQTRAASCRGFLTDLGHFLDSLCLQVVLSEQPLKLADDLREKEVQSLNDAVDKLKQVRLSPSVGADQS